MGSIDILIAALEIVEQRINEPLSAADLAKDCYSSCSGLRRLFANAFGTSVREYIIKRRLSHATKELLSGDKSITDIAMDYHYGSPEAFSRAFRRFWGVSPSEFRRTRRFTELFPRFSIDTNYGGMTMATGKPVDVSELYDELKKLAGTYVLGVDIRAFAEINDT